MRGLRGLVLAAALLHATAAFAVRPDEVLADPALEARARALSSQLRCLVCQNQSIDDSEAPLARDLRLLVRERLVAGDDDGRVRDFLTDRYGAFVLLRPPVEASTLLLWATPLVVLVAGAGVALGLRRRVGADAPRLDAREEARLAALLAKGGEAVEGRRDAAAS